MANLLPENTSTETIVELGRLGALSDGVFAIALTLLVLDIRLPDGITAGDLPASLLALAPRLLVYLISFIVIGGAWGSHQRLISQFRRGDGVLVWLNLLSLLFVTLLPATAALLGSFPGVFAAIVCFAVDVILIQLSALWLWRHAASGKLINPALDPRVITSIGRRLLLSAGAFALSVPLALLSATLVYIVWIALFMLVFTTDWLSWQQAIKVMKASVALEGARRAELSLTHTTGSLNLKAGAGKDQLLDGTFGGGVDVNFARQGDLMKTRLNTVSKPGLLNLRYPWSWGSAAALDWNILMNPEVPLKLTIEMSMNQVALDFRDIHLEELTLTSKSSLVDLWLPSNAGQTTARLQGSTATIIIHAPSTVGVHVRASSSVAGLEVDLNRFLLIDEGREYRSRDYDTAVNKVNIYLEIAWGSAQIL